MTKSFLSEQYEYQGDCKVRGKRDGGGGGGGVANIIRNELIGRLVISLRAH